MEKVTLYGLNKDQTFKVWSIWTSGNQLHIEHGKLGGALQTKSETVKGKNIGRANETTPAAQAEFEANSRINKQKDKGYRETKEGLQKLPLMPMLANDYRKQGHRIVYPAYVSPKLDGLRCLAKRTEEGVQLLSRYGKEYKLPLLQENLKTFMSVGQVFDGEIYLHGKELEEISSAVKKENELTPHLQFYVFDVLTVDSKSPFSERLLEFENISVRNNHWNIVFVPYGHVGDERDMFDHHKHYVANGYEGTMLRNHGGVYESGKRSADLQKYKDFVDSEFRIDSVFPDKDGRGVLQCWCDIAKDHFTVTIGDHAEREKQLESPGLYIGKLLTVKYQKRYKDTKLPQFPTGVAIRDYE